MLGFLRRYPVLSIVLVFVSTMVAVLGMSYGFGIWIMSSAECPSYPNDPCDAAPMLVMSLWMLSLPVSVGIAAFVSFVVYYLYIKE
ncbi:MAG: hypothetical protein ABI857_09520 [Acidobacteriota bacterium]